MRLVIDTNILFSFFRENPVRSIIINAPLLGLNLYTPEYAFEELSAHMKDLLKYTKCEDEEDIESIMQTLRKTVVVISPEFFQEYKTEAKIISPDEKDTPFFALALKLDAHIWSNERRLKRQKKIKVINTKELRELLQNENG